MATADHQQHLGQSTSWTPDSLPMGTDFMAWGQGAARHILRNRTTVDSLLITAGYKQTKVIDVVGGLLLTIQNDATSKDPKVWHYRPEGTDTGMEARLYGGRDAIIVTTTPHRSTNWEMQKDRRTDEPAAAEYSSLYGNQKPPYKFKMVIFDPGSTTEDQKPKEDVVAEAIPDDPGLEDAKGAYNLGLLAKASQIDRKLPPLGMKPQGWKYNYKGIPARFALMYQTEADGENDAWVRLSYPDGTQTSELYRFVQREKGKVHVALRVVNVSPSG